MRVQLPLGRMRFGLRVIRSSTLRHLGPAIALAAITGSRILFGQDMEVNGATQVESRQTADEIYFGDVEFPSAAMNQIQAVPGRDNWVAVDIEAYDGINPSKTQSVYSWGELYGDATMETLRRPSSDRPRELITLVLTNRPAMPIDQEDFDGLKALYNATDGNNWTDRNNWAVAANDPVPTVEVANTWHGVTVNSDGRVIRVVLPGNNLRGELPRQIGNFDHVFDLDLRSNRLTGAIPAEFGNLTLALGIDLGLNTLSGEVPSTLGNATALTTLNLDGNLLSGRIPDTFTALLNLYRFHIDGPNQTLCIPSTPALNSWRSTVSDFQGRVCTVEVGLSFEGSINDQTFELGRAVTTLVLPMAIDGQAPYNYSLSPSLPTGLSFDSQARTISGTPTVIWASTTYTYYVTDASGKSGSVQFSLSVVEEIVSSGSFTTDWQSLVRLYNGLGGGGWDVNTNWSGSLVRGPTPSELNTWHGVTVNAGRVTGLELEGNSLAGVLPEQLGDLTALESLDLSSNAIEGRIPSSVGNFEALSRLDLSDNVLTGRIPDSTGEITTLVELRLHGNEFIGEIPNSIGQLTSLMELNLGRNYLSGAIPDTIGSLTDIRLLDLGENSLVGQIPRTLGGLAQLNRLFVHNNLLVGLLPDTLTSLSGLSVLWFHGQAVCASTAAAMQTWLNLLMDRKGPDCVQQIGFADTVEDQSYVIGQAVGDLVFPEAATGDPPYIYSLVPVLPTGLMFDRNARRISGSPTETLQRTNFKYAVRDRHGLTGELAFTIEVNSVVHESDWRVLVSLYTSTRGGSWTENMNWSSSVSSVPEASELEAWYGVSMSEGRVTKLDLGGNDLAGGLPGGGG